MMTFDRRTPRLPLFLLLALWSLAAFADEARDPTARAYLTRVQAYHLYASYAVNLLHGIVEQASGQSFESFLTENAHVQPPAVIA